MQDPRAFLCLASAMAIVGSSVVAGRILVDGLPVFFGSAARFAAALAICLPLLLLLEGGSRQWRLLPRRDLAVLAGQALCGSFLFTVCLLYGLTLTGPAQAGVVMSTTPAVMAAMAWLFLGERPGRRTVLGIGLAVAGVALVNTAGAAPPASPTVAPHPFAGNALVLAAVVFESAFLLLRKGVATRLSALAATFWVGLFGLALFLPLGLWELARLDLAAVPAPSWWAAAYYGAVVTVGAYWLWFTGVVRVSGGRAGVFTALMPVSAVTLSALVLGEPLTPALLAGCGLVLGSVLVMTRP